MKGNIRRDRLFKNRGNDIARPGDFMVHTMIQEQSVYPGIALNSSKYTFIAMKTRVWHTQYKCT